ncbi:MAG: GtrA family protein [Rickettsiales bacterium]|nr:GtrA family protein [Rickettsiales bacterium]
MQTKNWLKYLKIKIPKAIIPKIIIPKAKIPKAIISGAIPQQALTFLLIGGLSTLISYSVFILCLHQFHFHYLVANAFGFTTSIGFNYQSNKRWTFKTKDSGYFKRYLSLYIISFFLSSVILRILVAFFGIIPEIANIITIILVTAFNFSGAKFLVFKK